MAQASALRRARAEVFITSAALVAVTLALVLLASGPIFADAVSTGALRRSLTDAPTSERAMVVDGRVLASELAATHSIVRDEVVAASGPLDVDVSQSVEAALSYSVPDQASEDRTDVVRIGWVERAEDHVTLVEGRWPDTDSTRDASTAGATSAPIDVVVDTTAADVFGLEVGATVRVTGRIAGSDELDVRIVGRFQVDDPFEPFWHGRDRIVEPVTVSPAFRTVNLLTDRTLLESVISRPDVGWLVLPSFDGIELDDVDGLRVRFTNLESEINGRLFDPELEPSPEMSVRSRLPELLRTDDRTLTVARAVIFATIAQLSALAAFALTLVAGLGIDARRSESVLLRARGAGPAQLTAQAITDAVLIVVPVALVAPLIAVVVVGWFDEFGPLTSIDLVLAPRPVAAAWWTTAVAAVVTIGLLVVPAARAAAAAAPEGATSRARLVGPVQRSGLDLAIVGAAAFAYWQLRVLGDDQAADLRGRFGVDPLVVLAPMFGIVAGALLVLRLLPLLAGLAERRAGRGRGVVGALTVWQLARRPHRYSRTTLLVTMAVAVGTFASVYETTWTESQRAQAAQEVSTDIRVEPNRRVGDSVGALQLTSLLQSIDGVETVMATVELPTMLPGETSEGRLVALQAGAAGSLDDAVGSDTLTALDTLAERRPTIPGIELPGAPVELIVPVVVTEVDQFGEPVEPDPDPAQPIRPPLAGSMTLTLQDADGLLHVVDAGSLAVDLPTRPVDLAIPEAGEAARPRSPLQIVDLELDTVTQGALPRFVEIEVGPIDVVDLDGSRRTVPLAGAPLTIDTETLGFLANPASGTVSSSEATGSATITVTTGSSLQAVRVVHTITRTQLPDVVPLAGIADRRWVARADITVGDVIGIPTDRIDELQIEIVDVIEVVPGVDPTTTAAILLDLPSMQWHERTGGRSTREISSYWLGLDDGTGTSGSAPGADTFTRPPVEALDVVVLEHRRAELTASPPALGSLGALGAGFLASVVLAVTALVLTAVVSVRERASEFAVLDALGQPRGQRRAWLVREQAVIVVIGAAIGTTLGLVLAQLVLPVTSFAQDGGSTFPPVSVVVPWRRIVGIVAAVAITSLAAVAAALTLRSRRSTGATLRTGVDG